METISPETGGYLASMCGVSRFSDLVEPGFPKHCSTRGSKVYFDSTPSPCTTSMLRELCGVDAKKRSGENVVNKDDMVDYHTLHKTSLSDDLYKDMIKDSTHEDHNGTQSVGVWVI